MNNDFAKTVAQGLAQGAAATAKNASAMINSNNDKILSTKDIIEIKSYMKSATDCITTFHADMNTLLTYIRSKEVMQSFFKSGLLGEEIEEKLERLNKILIQCMDLLYADAYSSLTFKTEAFLDNQENYVNTKR